MLGKRKKYPAPLDEPLYVDPEKWGRPDPGGGEVHQVLTKEQRKEQLRYRQTIRHEVETRVQWAFLVNGMEPVTPRSKAEWKLCELLARHVPGLQIENTPPKPNKRRGAPKTRGLEFDAVVLAAVNEARERHAKKHNKPVDEVSIPTAIANLHPEFRDLLKKSSGKPLKDSTVERRYRAVIKLVDAPLPSPDPRFPPLSHLATLGKNLKTD